MEALPSLKSPNEPKALHILKKKSQNDVNNKNVDRRKTLRIYTVFAFVVIIVLLDFKSL